MGAISTKTDPDSRLENQLLGEMPEAIRTRSWSQDLVKTYLNLQSSEQTAIASALGVATEEYWNSCGQQRHELFLQRIVSENQLHQLWKHLHGLSPFETNENPF